MMKIINKIILPIVLITALVAFEIGCQYICRALMPDETDKVYTYTKSTNTLLMVINDEDDSRFYPRMAAIKSETISISDYLNDLYAQQFGKTESQTYSELWDKSAEKMTNDAMTALEGKLEMTVFVFSGIECQDLLSAARIEKDTGLICIQDHTISVSDDKTKELSLIIRLDDLRVLYYRLSDLDSKEATPAELNQASKKLISDINAFLPHWNDLYFPNNAHDAEIDDYDVFIEDQRRILLEQAKTLSSDYPDNKITDWFSKLYMNLSDKKQQLSVSCFEEKTDEMSYLSIITAIFSMYQNDSEITVAFPFHLSGNDGKPSEQEYHIYSSGDEIMIVFETGAKYQTILYYDVSEGCFTGFSA